METPKPKILAYSLESDDPDNGISLPLYRLLMQEFHVLFPADLQQDSALYSEIEGAIIRTTWQPMMNEYLRQLPNVKVVCAMGAGVNHIDFEFCRSRGILVGNNPDCVTKATADHAMGLLIATARQLFKGAAIAKEGIATDLLSKDVSGATLGIVGMGRIGFQVARRAQGFDMRVLYHNRHRRQDLENQLAAEYCLTLHEMLPKCDFVVITCPLTSQTRHMFSEPEFRLMKDDAILINVARGGIVDTESLVTSLRHNLIGGAGLDVTEPETLPRDHPLLHMDSVLVLPHWGSSTLSTRTRMHNGVVANLVAVLKEGRRPVNEASPIK